MAKQQLVAVQIPLPLQDCLEREPVVAEPLPFVGQQALEELHRSLGLLLEEPIDLVGTDNRRSLISWKRDETGLLQVRIQKLFALGGAAIVHAIARFIRTRDPEARALLRHYASTFSCLTEPGPARFAPPSGRHHDLRVYLRDENRRWFDNSYRGRIGWSRRTRVSQRTRIRLGSWSDRHRLIRVHPVLDQPGVPNYVVRFVVFHEMLHADLSGRKRPAKRAVHSREFRRRESQHPDHGLSQDWISSNLDALLTY